MTKTTSLTEPQLAALRAAAKSEDPWRAARSAHRVPGRRPSSAGRSASLSIGVLLRRELLEDDPDSDGWRITAADQLEVASHQAPGSTGAAPPSKTSPV